MVVRLTGAAPFAESVAAGATAGADATSPADPPCAMGVLFPRSVAEHALRTTHRTNRRLEFTECRERGRRNLLHTRMAQWQLSRRKLRPRVYIQHCMSQPFPIRILLLLPLLVAGCRDFARSASNQSPPATEFVLAAGDSAFWVTSDAKGVHTRGAPLNLALVGGRFVELYVVDDDHSFHGAELIGQRVYRRDLRSGDSVLVYTDSVIPRIARDYARLHPDDEPVTPDEDVDENPLWRATATLDLRSAHGPFVSYTVHTDIEKDRTPLWHESRRGVLDLRFGRPATLGDVVGADSDDVAHRRAGVLKTTFDSIRGIHDERGVRASAQLAHYHVDAGSFAITTVDGSPAIAYALPGAGQGDAGHMLPLPPLAFSEPLWWNDATSSLPIASVDGGRDLWRRGAYSVVVRYDSAGGARLAIRDSSSREWPAGPVASPARRIYWLDRPPVDRDTRHALSKAFDEAKTYGDGARVAASHRPKQLSLARYLK
ncbi:MAG: hypothetical protein JWM95_1813 [Gemmatimonadetes bacterium]|nr:hypothetical protein [Gemmatimonadota bacterium]